MLIYFKKIFKLQGLHRVPILYCHKVTLSHLHLVFHETFSQKYKSLNLNTIIKAIIILIILLN